MNLRMLVTASTLLIACGASRDPSLLERQKALEEGQAAIRKDLAEIKALLQARSQRATPPPERAEVTLSVDGDPFKGAKDAKITLVEFSDYQCPFCARHASQTFPQIDNEYVQTGKLKYVFRDFPLEQIHPHAAKAAEAAHCAGEAGKYWEMHGRLFGNQKALGAEQLPAHAKAIGLDGARFQACLASGKYADTVKRDLSDGSKAGVRGSPTFYLGITDPKSSELKAVRILRGAQPYERFKEAIESLLAEKTKT